jgi:Protein of unknown function (DUF3486)
MRKSRIKGLPATIKAWLDKYLVENNFSGYDALVAELKKHGCEVSRSSLHRYGQDFEQRLAMLKLSTEQAKAMVAAAPDDEGAVSEALMRMTQETIYRVLLNFSVDPNDPPNLASIAKAVAALSRANVNEKKWKKEVQAEAALVSEKVGAAAKKGGLSDDVVNQIKMQILGIGA